MIQTSSKWKQWSAEYGLFHIKATLDNGTTLNLTDEDFMLGSVSITDSVSGMSVFNVGAVITNSFNATLNNFTGKFNSYNLAGATIGVQFYIGEYYKLGYYGIDGNYYSSTTRITTGLIKANPNTAYTLKWAVNGFDFIEFNADGEYVHGTWSIGASPLPGEMTITTQATTEYIAINFDTAYGTTFNNDFTIEDSSGDLIWGEYTEVIDRGVYTLEKPTSLGSTIKVTGYDDMDKLNKYYIGKHPVGGVESDIIFPLNAETLAMYLCDYCEVDYEPSMWSLSSFQIDEFEYNESTTCRQVLSWIMQVAGGYARVNPIGKLECKGFNLHFWSVGDVVNGGTIDPWESVSAISGGTFSPWSSVTDYNGGSSGGAEFTLSKIKSLDVYVDDIEITGVRAFANNTVNEFEFDTVGNAGYILELSDNPMITDNTLAVATRVYGQIGGLMFRPFNASIFGDPSFEAGDVIALMDYLGNEHISLITSLTYNLNQAERLECNAETPKENENATPNPAVSIMQGATYASYDYILAKKISADYISAGNLGVNGTITASDLEITGGKTGGFTILNGRITSTYTTPHTYTNSDISIINNIISQGLTPTQEELELYDIDGDGEITQEDSQLVSDIIQYESGVLTTTVIFDPTSYKQAISVEDNMGNKNSIGGYGGIFSDLMLDGDFIGDFVEKTTYSKVSDTSIMNPGLVMVEKYWHSGILEVDGSLPKKNLAVTSSYGGMKYVNIVFDSYLNLFTETPFVTANVSCSVGLYSISIYAVSTSGFSAYLWSPQSETHDFWINFRMVGKWK